MLFLDVLLFPYSSFLRPYLFGKERGDFGAFVNLGTFEEGDMSLEIGRKLATLGGRL